LTNAPSSRPRVLLVDDHIALLESTGRYLAPAFDVVARAAGGREALELARRLHPDLVVLDVAMPELDGFQTLEQLRRESPHSRVVFLTMHHDDDFVSAAINAGAHGYVLKSHIARDLISAIDHALAGRLFVPSLTSLSSVSGGRHAVQFHVGPAELLDHLTELVVATLRSGAPVVMVASDETRVSVARRLHAQQMNPAERAERGQYIETDAALAVSHIMHDGRPDKRRIGEIVHELDRLRLAAAKDPRDRLTIVGEVAVSVCLSGDFEAALEVERIWDELTRSLPFFTVCSYPIDCFAQPPGRDRLQRLCATHNAVTS
jgi:DNA-binding NarL/FixJ family response regulator